MSTAPGKPATDLESYKELAEQVIRQALADATSPTVSRAVRNSARAFLEGSPALREWCDIANLPVEAVIEHARHVLTDVPASSPHTLSDAVAGTSRVPPPILSRARRM